MMNLILMFSRLLDFVIKFGLHSDINSRISFKLDMRIETTYYIDGLFRRCDGRQRKMSYLGT